MQHIAIVFFRGPKLSALYENRRLVPRDRKVKLPFFVLQVMHHPFCSACCQLPESRCTNCIDSAITVHCCLDDDAIGLQLHVVSNVTVLLQVPGLVEKRPNLIIGDLVYLRSACLCCTMVHTCMQCIGTVPAVSHTHTHTHARTHGRTDGRTDARTDGQSICRLYMDCRWNMSVCCICSTTRVIAPM